MIEKRMANLNCDDLVKRGRRYEETITVTISDLLQKGNIVCIILFFVVVSHDSGMFKNNEQCNWGNIKW